MNLSQAKTKRLVMKTAGQTGDKSTRQDRAGCIQQSNIAKTTSRLWCEASTPCSTNQKHFMQSRSQQHGLCCRVAAHRRQRVAWCLMHRLLHISMDCCLFVAAGPLLGRCWAGVGNHQLQQNVLPGFVARYRWFGSGLLGYWVRW